VERREVVSICAPELGARQELLSETVARIGGRLVVLSGEDSEHTDLHAVAQIGTLEVRAAS
jgi:hypothetical protein